jgi:hypothetical protein
MKFKIFFAISIIKLINFKSSITLKKDVILIANTKNKKSNSIQQIKKEITIFKNKRNKNKKKANLIKKIKLALKNIMEILFVIYTTIFFLLLLDPRYQGKDYKILGNYLINNYVKSDIKKKNYENFLKINLGQDHDQMKKLRDFNILSSIFTPKENHRVFIDHLLSQSRDTIEKISKEFHLDDKFYFKEIGSNEIKSIHVKDLILSKFINEKTLEDKDYLDEKNFYYNIFFIIYFLETQEHNIFYKSIKSVCIKIIKNHNSPEKAYQETEIINTHNLNIFQKIFRTIKNFGQTFAFPIYIKNYILINHG